ncbi:MAG: hypothetical protein HZC48_00645 [Nitrospirae bacterium]|nr:hypothetical protein [Nitrospirota bacterium]MBI5674321.1 hypothetical protein [Nitrospirota bacterium]
MGYLSQAPAKQFFISKVVNQAEQEGVNLSKAEKYMLAWSESDPSFVIDNDLNEQFEKEITQEEFEKKIQALIKQAYETDISKDKDMKETYRTAYKALKQGDHFILIMINAAIGSKLRKWGLF